MEELLVRTISRTIGPLMRWPALAIKPRKMADHRSLNVSSCDKLESDNFQEFQVKHMAANPDNLSTHFFSLDEYFALEHAGDARYEYWNGEIVCMSGGTRAHGRIVMN